MAICKPTTNWWSSQKGCDGRTLFERQAALNKSDFEQDGFFVVWG